MALSRRLGVVAILSSCWFVAVGCGDDDSKNTSGAESGAGGEGGDDGTGAGGTKNTAGKGGSSAGTGNNNAGSSAGGGMAGAGGDVAQAGVGGGGDEPVAGGGGDGGTGPSGGGEGGGTSAGGAGGEGGAPIAELKTCSYECDSDDDCAILPDNTEFKCNLETNTCAYPAKCATSVDCVPSKSTWLSTCASDAECTEFEACIEFEGEGHCAWLPEQDDLCSFGGVPEVMPRFGASGTTRVCVERGYFCNAASECEPGCLVFGCGLGQGDTCNEATGLCECAAPTECESGVCRPDHSCAQCATSADCADLAQFGFDVCVDGTCGCSSASVCPDRDYKGATTVCE